MDVQSYISRFHAPFFEEKSLTYLMELQRLHLEHIPFENLDVIRKTPIYLNLQNIYKKIVCDHRGGYCYELNGLFQSFLQSIGYDAQLVAATVRRPNGEWTKADTHAAILVQLDVPYLVDVGFGADSPRSPIPLNGDPITNCTGTHRVIVKDSTVFDLSYKGASEERILYRFNTTPKNLIDFHEGCVFNQVSKYSSFTHTDIITKATAAGKITIIDRTLLKFENGNQTKKELTVEEKDHYLQNIFGINLK